MLPVLPRKCILAVLAVVDIATHGSTQPVTAKALAKRHRLAPRRLERILQTLVQEGVLKSMSGPSGGYMLARAASDVKIGHVIREIDGPLAPIACASRSAYEPCGDCKSVKACAVRFTMVKVREAISDVLDRMTIADMVAVSEGGNVTPIVAGRPTASARKRR